MKDGNLALCVTIPKLSTHDLVAFFEFRANLAFGGIDIVLLGLQGTQRLLVSGGAVRNRAAQQGVGDLKKVFSSLLERQNKIN